MTGSAGPKKPVTNGQLGTLAPSWPSLMGSVEPRRALDPGTGSRCTEVVPGSVWYGVPSVPRGNTARYLLLLVRYLPCPVPTTRSLLLSTEQFRHCRTVQSLPGGINRCQQESIIAGRKESLLAGRNHYRQEGIITGRK